MIKRVKAKEQALRMEGMSGAQASKVAAGLVTGVKRKKKGKEGGGSGGQEDGGGGGELFDGDGLPGKLGGAAGSGGKTSVYAGGARSGKVRPPRGGGKLGKAELNKVKRGGKSKQAFKSKGKHKRR
jgi:ATP-dependent RNA helicase DDX27